jgi:DNA-directed RNA polymerase specialized sigma24 family protein
VSATCKENAFRSTNDQETVFMRTNSSQFDGLVAFYYPAVYSFAARLTDDPRDAVALTRQAFNSARKQLQRMRSQTAIATVLVAAVLRAGHASA